MKGSRTGNNLWLTLRFLRKQKLRTMTIFCGMLFSCFLLTAFGSLGYDFWRQVHSGTDETAEFDSTQNILILLVVVLLLLVASCAAILLHNLFLLTFMQKWKSQNRLLALGADFWDVIVMEVIEKILLYSIAAPVSYMFTFLLCHWIGIEYQAPFWIIGVGMLWIFLFSCICGIRPLLAAFCKPEGKHPKEHKWHKKRMRTTKKASSGFLWYMSGKYRYANRGHYVRITITVIAAILLYVPVSYLIDTNISVQQSGLYAKYGIEYSCSPRKKEELAAALEEYSRLAEYEAGGREDSKSESMLCVSLYTAASVRMDAISSELRGALKDAGWDSRKENGWMTVGATILFVDSHTYMECVQTADEAELLLSHPAILFNRYTNRNRWSETSDVFFRETSLLTDKADGSAVQVYYDVTNEYEPDRTKYIVPELIIGELPEGIDFTGDLFLILPLGCMENVCLSDEMYERLWVCGKWEDNKEGVFERLEQCLGEHSMGQLIYTRKILKEWYSSMNGIHMAMNAICMILFSVAVLNIFSMMIFQYMERKKGLAILWSVGQSTKDLLHILLAENVVPFLTAIVTGIPLSVFLCYIIYRIFRQAWQIIFTLPIKQVALISVSALIVSAVALLLDGILMKHQNFLADIKEIT